MGYSTDFTGSLKITPSPSSDLTKYVNKFSNSRRMVRTGLDPLYGIDGEYYIHDESNGVTNYNQEPATQPGLWCQWVINGNKLEWDGGEKFYNYEEWLLYMIENFFAPSGYKLNGVIKWQGEESQDKGAIQVTDNVIHTIRGATTTPTKVTSATYRKLIKMCFTRSYPQVAVYTKFPQVKSPLDFKALLKKPA